MAVEAEAPDEPLLFNGISNFKFAAEMLTCFLLKNECSDRDSNPGFRLERPVSLTGLDDRSLSIDYVLNILIS